jgi:hypothetical protein
MSRRAARLMSKLGGKVENGASTTAAGGTPGGMGGDGSVSQLGLSPDGPLRKRSKVVGSKTERLQCPACHYQGIVAEAMICPECGQMLQNEDWESRQKRYRQNLVEGKEVKMESVGWISQAVQEILTALKSSKYTRVDEDDEKELQARLHQTFSEFATWRTSKETS